MRFTSHLDDVRVWERTVRRAGLPLAFTAGFSPRPRMQFGPALPTCYESTAEYIDLELSARLDPDDLVPAVTAVLPEGMAVLEAREVEPRSPALQATVEAVEYLVPLRGDVEGLALELERLLASDSLPLTISKKGQYVDVDVRPGLLDARVLDLRAEQVGSDTPLPRLHPSLLESWAGSLCVWCRLGTQPRSVRPTEVLSLVDGASVHLVHRCAQLLPAGDGWLEPIPLETHLRGGQQHEAAALRSPQVLAWAGRGASRGSRRGELEPAGGPAHGPEEAVACATGHPTPGLETPDDGALCPKTNQP